MLREEVHNSSHRESYNAGVVNVCERECERQEPEWNNEGRQDVKEEYAKKNQIFRAVTQKCDRSSIVYQEHATADNNQWKISSGFVLVDSAATDSAGWYGELTQKQGTRQKDFMLVSTWPTKKNISLLQVSYIKWLHGLLFPLCML